MTEILTPRDVPLGGLRAMNVRRTLPQRQRSLIGAWCFLDHYGPDQVDETGAPPHRAADRELAVRRQHRAP
jgi:redox-sensitive bicupin YhaK (pirin superfamily)